MPTELLVTIASAIGIIIGAIVNQFLTRNKYVAEVEKIRAEADKARAEAEKTRTEIQQSKLQLRDMPVLNHEQIEEVANRITEKVKNIQAELHNRPPEALYQPPRISDRLIYIYEVWHDIENKIRWLVLSWGGGWAGCSMADFDSYFEKAKMANLMPEGLANEINDFYYYTRSIINGGDVSDTQFLRIQYLAANINYELTSSIETHIADGDLPLAQG